MSARKARQIGGLFRRRHPKVLEALGWLQLIEPVKADRFHDPAVDDDNTRLGLSGVEALMGAIGGNVDEVARSPCGLLRRLVPFPYEFVLAVEAHIVVEVVARAFDDIGDFLGEVPAGAGGAAGAAGAAVSTGLVNPPLCRLPG